MSNDNFSEFIRCLFTDMKFADEHGYYPIFQAAFDKNLVRPDRIRKVKIMEDERYLHEGKKCLIFSFEEVYGRFKYLLDKMITAFLSEEDPFSANMLKKKTKEKIVSDVIIIDLIGKEGVFEVDSKFIKDQTGNLFYFYDDIENDHLKPQIFTVRDNKKDINAEFQSFINLRYNLFDSSKILKNIVDYAISNYVEQDIHKDFYFNNQTNVLYIFDREYHVFKLNGINEPEIIPNGLEVLFKPSSGNKINLLTLAEVIDYPNYEVIGSKFKTGNKLFDSIINIANLETESYLDFKEQLFILLLYFFSIPFISILETKPVMIFTGNSETGKTFVMELILKFLMGKNNFVYNFTKDDKDNFKNACVNETVVCIDNLDKFYDWLEDLICSTVTGAGFSYRTFFKNLEQTTVRPLCLYIITSRMKFYTREDFVSRLLQCSFKSLGKNKKNKREMLDQIIVHYDYLWSVFIYQLNKIVYQITKKEFTNLSSKHRIVEWIELSKNIIKALDLESIYNVSFDQILEKVHIDRSLYELSNITFKDVLVKLRDKKPDFSFTSRELLNEMLIIDPSLILTPLKLGIIISSHKRAFEDALGLYVIEDKYKNQNLYRFQFSEENEVIENNSNELANIGASEDIEISNTRNDFSKNDIIGLVSEKAPKLRNNLDTLESLEHIWLDKIYNFTRNTPKSYDEIKMLVGSESWTKLETIFEDFKDKGFVTQNSEGLYSYNK